MLYFAAIGDCAAQQSKQAEPSDVDSVLEDSRAVVSEHLFDLVDTMDSAFDDLRSEEQRRDDWFRIGLGVRFQAASATQLRQRVRAAINLKPFGERLQLVIDSVSSDDVVGGKVEEGSTDENDSRRRLKGDSGFAGLRLPLWSNDTIITQFEAGGRFQSGIYPLTGFRWAIRQPVMDKLIWEPTQFSFWDGEDGFGTRGRSDFNYQLTDSAFARSRLEALWAETTEGVDLYKEFSAYQELTEGQYLGFAAGAFALTRPSWNIDVYRLSARYRFLIWSDWLFAEIEPGVDFPDDRDYRRTPFIGFRLDALFTRQSRIDKS